MELKDRILLINTCLAKVDNSKVTLAMELFKARRDVYWKDTPYVYFGTFCKEEVALSSSSIFKYLSAMQLAERNKFSVEQMALIVNTIGWCRFAAGLTKIAAEEIISVAVFIDRYKAINLDKRVTYEESESKLVSFNFAIPQKAADDLTAALLTRGMRVTNKSRTNMSAAMVKLIKDLKIPF